MTPGKAFVIGALSKTIATIVSGEATSIGQAELMKKLRLSRIVLQVTFPYILAKVRLQAKYDPEHGETVLTTGSSAVVEKKKERYSSAFDVLRKIYAEKGFAGWYQVRFIVSSVYPLEPVLTLSG
jgi:hypothetical protein